MCIHSPPLHPLSPELVLSAARRLLATVLHWLAVEPVEETLRVAMVLRLLSDPVELSGAVVRTPAETAEEAPCAAMARRLAMRAPACSVS